MPVAIALVVGAAPTADAAPSDEQLLERHRPLLRYDAQERYFAQPAEDPGDMQAGPDLVYGHVARESGETYLQYWLFFAENTQDRGIFKTGRHEGDWELVQVGLGDEGEAEEVTFSQHSSAETCAIGDAEVEDGRVVAYVANGSHALYPAPGNRGPAVPGPERRSGRHRAHGSPAGRFRDG